MSNISYYYLQEAIGRLFDQKFEATILLKANRNDERDLQLFLENDVDI